jgi:hypothetical protein
MELPVESTLNIRNEVVFYDRATRQPYRRIVGALAWPAPPKPGFLCAVAEESSPAVNRGDQPRLWIVGEREASSIDDLYRGCLELRESCKVIKWLADLSPARKPEKDQFRHCSREWAHNPNPILLHTAPYSDTSPTLAKFATILQDLLSPEKLLLQFMEGGLLSGYLARISPEEANRSAADYPAYAALAFCCAEMVIRNPYRGVGVFGGGGPNVKRSWDMFHPPYQR